MVHPVLCIILYVLSICEAPCGEVSFENTSNEMQTIVVVSSTGSNLQSFTILSNTTAYRTLSGGKYNLTVVPAEENYSLIVEGCSQSQSPTPESPQTDFLFSVSSERKVRFSQGNLQYQASTDTWRFAEHQYDYVGDAVSGNVSEGSNLCDNSQISSSYSGWIDLFGWGTSGYNGKMPFMTSNAYADYGDGNNDIAATNYDWGVFCTISNGGGHEWRTLTTQEWEYLIKRSNTLYGQATVCNVRGCVLLPDDWQLPVGLTFTPKPYNYETNTYNTDEWNKMESNGAVFLPAAGDRYNNTITDTGESPIGYYWTSSAYGTA